uniref:Uncharacterized protein n=1 Tax=Schizophyllum commune (strain H4-8 / FGSC 9210) TaxID=578458 RepID=D8Q5G1_SCHCM
MSSFGHINVEKQIQALPSEPTAEVASAIRAILSLDFNKLRQYTTQLADSRADIKSDPLLKALRQSVDRTIHPRLGDARVVVSDSGCRGHYLIMSRCSTLCIFALNILAVDESPNDYFRDLEVIQQLADDAVQSLKIRRSGDTFGSADAMSGIEGNAAAGSSFKGRRQRGKGRERQPPAAPPMDFSLSLKRGLSPSAEFPPTKIGVFDASNSGIAHFGDTGFVFNGLNGTDVFAQALGYDASKTMLEAAASIARRQSYGDGKPHLSSVMKLLKEVTAHENTLVLGIGFLLEAQREMEHCRKGLQGVYKSLTHHNEYVAQDASDGPEVPGSRRTARSPAGWRDRELESASRDLRDASPDSRRRIKADYDNAFLNDRPTSEDEMDDAMAAETAKAAATSATTPDSVAAVAPSSSADPAPMEVDEGSLSKTPAKPSAPSKTGSAEKADTRARGKAASPEAPAIASLKN